MGHPEEVLEVKLMVGSEGSAVVEVEAGAEGAEVSDVVAAGSEAAWRAASEVEVEVVGHESSGVMSVAWCGWWRRHMALTQSLEGILPVVVSKVFLCQAGMCQERLEMHREEKRRITTI